MVPEVAVRSCIESLELGAYLVSEAAPRHHSRESDPLVCGHVALTFPEKKKGEKRNKAPPPDPLTLVQATEIRRHPDRWEQHGDRVVDQPDERRVVAVHQAR